MNNHFKRRILTGRLFLAYFAFASVSVLYPNRQARAQGNVLEQAQNAYYDAKFDDCITLLAPLVVTGNLSDVQLDTALQFLGAAHQQKGDVSKARETFQDLVTFDNNAQIDERFFPADAVTVFQEAKRDYLASLDKVGFFKISGQGPDAHILIDGKRRKNTEDPFKVAVGKHRLEFRKAGQTPFVREAELKRQGETVAIQVRDEDWQGAAMALGTLIMVLDPLDAAVEIDGRPVSLAEGKTELVPGKHTYRVSRDGYADKTGSFEVKTGKTATVSAKLKPVSGTRAEVTGEKKSSSKKFLYIGAAAVGVAAIVAVAAAGGGGEGGGNGGPTGPLGFPPPPPSKPAVGGGR
ncbi:MAG: PEGA domain-containing protein [candidate division Zixibacteria bacterium]|nr:PEGA domain-containing protein [candidate division Zixibacteria bacterium]